MQPKPLEEDLARAAKALARRQKAQQRREAAEQERLAKLEEGRCFLLLTAPSPPHLLTSPSPHLPLTSSSPPHPLPRVVVPSDPYYYKGAPGPAKHYLDELLERASPSSTPRTSRSHR